MRHQFGFGVAVSWSRKHNAYAVTWRGSVKKTTTDRKEAFDYADTLLPKTGDDA